MSEEVKVNYSSREEIELKGYKVSFMGLYKICGRKEARILVRKFLAEGLNPTVLVKIGEYYQDFFPTEDVLRNRIRWVDSKKFATRMGAENDSYVWLSKGCNDYKELKKYPTQKKRERKHPKRKNDW